MKSYNPPSADRVPRRTDEETTAKGGFGNRKIAAVILCAGRGERMGLPYNKLLYHLGEKTILETTIGAFKACEWIDEILCAASPADFDVVTELCIDSGASVCIGGETRTASVRNALSKLHAPDIVLIHDGARPFVTPKLIGDAVRSAIEYGSGIVAVPTVDAIRVVRGGEIVQTPNRDKLYNVQTPQAFRFGEIADAYARVRGDYADDSEVYRLAGYAPRIVRGEYTNRKITTMSDVFNMAEAYRIGFGYDVHRLVEGRDLVLGGIYIPFEKGLLGHSDADVLVHAVMDALLSAAGLPDIGVLFPDTDEQYKDISSLRLLERVRDALEERGGKILGISAVVMAEKPKLAKLRASMIERIASTLNIAETRVNIGATTTEKLGIVGDGAGIASAACALVSL